MTFPDGRYLEWRQQGSAFLHLAEDGSRRPPPERWLQEIWAHQRLQRHALATVDGRPLRILHPGFWNREAGPDFLGAVVQTGEDAPVSGDVEIDLLSSGWKSHGHAGNAAYHNVVLHVVWEPPASPPLLPTLVLQDRLDAPLEELEAWVGGSGDASSEWLQGECCAPLRDLDAEALAQVLRQAAHARLRTKGYQFRARARVVGWHQALWEGVFRALGYKHNAWPMQSVAERLPDARQHPPDPRDPRESWEARLLGLAGLLPPEPGKGTRARRLWDLWWREREVFQAMSLPAALWRLNGVRPANHPQRRLALAAAWIADDTREARLERWFQELPPTAPHAEAAAGLLAVFEPEADGFWRRHYTLTSRPLPEAPPLLGAGRLNDLAVNCVLPWLWARAEAGGDAAPRERVESLYFEWPPGEDNATLKLARTRLLGELPFPGRKTAALQQGLLQIVRDFCTHSDALCTRCRFPELVRAVATHPPAPRPG